jgi:hypothetical protein
MPDPVTESEVHIELKWTADARTKLAKHRQTKLMGFDRRTITFARSLPRRSPATKPGQSITSDGRLVSGSMQGFDRDGLPQDV